MSMKKSLCEHCYYKNDCPVDPNYKAERAPAIITTCTDYASKRDYCEQINSISVPMSQVPEEIKQQWIQDYYEPEVNCDTNCIDCNFYDDCESPFKLDEQTMDFWLNERDYESK